MKQATQCRNPLDTHKGQLQIWHDKNRFKTVCAGRRWGKTYLSREKLISCLELKNKLYWYIAPTRGHAKDLMWDELKTRLDQLGWRYYKNETALSIIRKKTNTGIILKSAERYDRLRGKGLDGVILDECSDIVKEAWTESVRPALSDKRGWAWFIGTPKGYNWFHDLYQEAKIQQNWSAFQFRTIDNPIFQTPEGLQEIEAAKRDLDERTFRQEYLATFESFSGRIIYAFDRSANHTDHVYDDTRDVIVGLDFNVLPMSACIFQKFDGKLVQVAEISLNSSSTEEMCRVIRDKYGKRNVTIRPDSSGKNRQAATGVSSFHIIRQFNFDMQALSVNPRRTDRWASVNRAYEQKATSINTKTCPKTTKDLETMCYKEGTCEPDLQGKMHGHLFDANGYGIFREYPITSKQKIKVYNYI